MQWGTVSGKDENACSKFAYNEYNDCARTGEQMPVKADLRKCTINQVILEYETVFLFCSFRLEEGYMHMYLCMETIVAHLKPVPLQQQNYI